MGVKSSALFCPAVMTYESCVFPTFVRLTELTV